MRLGVDWYPTPTIAIGHLWTWNGKYAMAMIKDVDLMIPLYTVLRCRCSG
jgi:hypothetical protein